MTAPKREASAMRRSPYTAAGQIVKPTLPKKKQLKDPVDTVRESEEGFNVKVKYGEFVESPVDKHGIELGHYMDELDRKGMILPKKKKNK